MVIRNQTLKLFFRGSGCRMGIDTVFRIAAAIGGKNGYLHGFIFPPGDLELRSARGFFIPLKHLYMEFLTVFVRNSKNISEKISSRIRFVTFVTPCCNDPGGFCHVCHVVTHCGDGPGSFVTFVTLSRPVATVQESFVTFVTHFPVSGKTNTISLIHSIAGFSSIPRDT